MPSAESLPEALRPLADYNATSLADSRWSHDVTRLAKVISFDLPGSLAERKLNAVNFLVCASVLAATIFTTLVLGSRLTAAHEAGQGLIGAKLAAVNYVALFPAAVLLLVFSGQMDGSRRRFAIAGALTAFLGAGLAIIAYARWHEPLLYIASTILIPLMLALMSLSGMRPKW